MRIFAYSFFLLIVLLGTTFAYLNAGAVKFNYYLGQVSLPLSLLLVIALGFGLLLGLIATAWPWFKLHSKHISLKKRLRYTEQEVNNLRSMPLQNAH